METIITVREIVRRWAAGDRSHYQDGDGNVVHMPDWSCCYESLAASEELRQEFWRIYQLPEEELTADDADFINRCMFAFFKAKVSWTFKKEHGHNVNVYIIGDLPKSH